MMPFRVGILPVEHGNMTDHAHHLAVRVRCNTLR